MGEGREEEMGQGMGALPTEVGRSAAPDGVEPASPSQAKPAAANAWTPLGLKWLADGAPYGERYLKWREANACIEGEF